MTDEFLKQVCNGYRATVQEAPYDALDQALLRAAVRHTRGRPWRRAMYGAAASLLALAVVSGLWIMAPRHRFHGTIAQLQAPRVSTFLAPEPSARTAPLLDTAAVMTVAPPEAPGAVDLNAPGALDALKTQRPRHYREIMGILAGLTQHPERDVVRWITANFPAEDVIYMPYWLTSFPPKRELNFSLDKTRYHIVVTITQNGARVLPVETGQALRCQRVAADLRCVR